MSRKRKALSFKEKLDVLKKVDENPQKKRVDLAKELGLAPSTLCTIVGQREVILKNAQHFGVNVKQAKTATHVKLEEVLLTWFREVTAAGVNVDGKVLREKADSIALLLGIENFQASGGWLHRFKERHGLVYRVVSGEGKKVDESAVDEWLNKLPALISEYAPRDIFNADEAGLFFNLQPERSLCVKGQACQGGQKSKERVTVLFCCNSDGSEKLQLTVIGKSKKPRCFRSAERLPVLYKGNRKAWMTGDFFREFLTTLDRRMASRNRKILLFVDQCSAHPKETTFNNVTVRFLPANTTSHLQPLDAGIIRNVKHHFKGLLVRRLLAKIDRKEANLRISLLDALHFLAMSWDNVTADTISNCFRKCGFAIGLDAGSARDYQEPDDFTIDGWDSLETQASARDFVTADDNVATCGLRSIDELVSEADDGEHEADSDGEDADECGEPPSTADTLHALDVLRRTVSAGSVSDETAARFYAFQAGLVRDINGKKVQTSITDFFGRK